MPDLGFKAIWNHQDDKGNEIEIVVFDIEIVSEPQIQCSTCGLVNKSDESLHSGEHSLIESQMQVDIYTDKDLWQAGDVDV